MHSSPKFSFPHHLLTAGLFQEFLFCLYSTYLCALRSTSLPKFSLPHHLLTAGLFQEFLFCLYSTYLCALGSTSLPCLLATLHWCRRYRENSVFNTMTMKALCNFLLENIQPDFFRKRSHRIFSNFTVLKIYT